VNTHVPTSIPTGFFRPSRCLSYWPNPLCPLFQIQATTSGGRFSSGQCRRRDALQSTQIPTQLSFNHTQHLVAPGICILFKKMPICHVPLTRAFVSAANKGRCHTRVHNSPFSPNALAKRVWEIWISVSNKGVTRKLNEFYANRRARSG